MDGHTDTNITASSMSAYHLLSSAPQPITLILATILIILITTRIWSSRNSTPHTQSSNDPQPVPAVPYWIPIVGHIPNMALDADGFVKRLRHRYTQGAFALNFFGTQHNIVYTPGLATALLSQKAEHADFEDVVDGMLQNIYGLPKRDMPRYRESRAALMGCYRLLLSEPSLGEMVGTTARRLRENVVQLVSFAASPVDEMPWEGGGAGIKITKDGKGEEVVESSMLPLIRDFCAHTAIPTLVGSDFLINFPDCVSSIWTIDRGFTLLAAGLPRWLPIPMLTRAHIAKKKALEEIDAFHRALDMHANGEDPGMKWQNLDDVGSLVKARLEVYRQYNWSIRARSAIELSLLWAANANSDVLVFWMLNRIYADPELLARLREEMLPYVRAVQPKQELAIAELPRFEVLDVEGLCENCPLLKNCYVESLRLDTASWSLKVVKQDFVLQSREKDSRGWTIKKGQYCHSAHDLHCTDPQYFEDPLVWKADRHIRQKADSGEKPTAEMGSIRPYGGGVSMCKGRAFAFKECMTFVAAIIAVWDIEPAGGGEWKLPRHRKATGVYGTGDDTRIWLRRRKLSS